MVMRFAVILATVMTVAVAQTARDSRWESELKRQLPLLGHRNWVVVADSAYPWQTAPGITTVETSEDQLTVLKATLKAVAKCSHVRPTFFTDAELPFVPEGEAKGVTSYRKKLAVLLKNRQVNSLLHEKIIANLDEAGKTFHVLLLKTKLTIPYTSVFIRLDCAYWGDVSEKKLREAMKGGK